MDINGVVNYSSCSKSTIRRAVSDGSLICSKATGKLLFKKTIDVCISFIGRNSGNQNSFIAGLD